MRGRNFTDYGTPADMETYRAKKEEKRRRLKPVEVTEEEMRMAKYEVIIGQFNQIVSKQTEWEPNDERPSQIR